MSGDEPLRVFATGDARQLTLEVQWRDGQRTVIRNAEPNYLYEIDEPATDAPTPVRVPSPAPPAPLFLEVSDRLSHRHFEEPFDDFAQQPLLPYRLSRLGPGVGWLDLDGDGRLDLVAGNWGLNSPYGASPAQPLRLFYGDFDQNGMVDLIEAYDVPGIGLAPRRDFDTVAAALPFVRSRFASRRAYAQASVRQVLGPQAGRAHELTANTLAATVFLNRGRRVDRTVCRCSAAFRPRRTRCQLDIGHSARPDRG